MRRFTLVSPFVLTLSVAHASATLQECDAGVAVRVEGTGRFGGCVEPGGNFLGEETFCGSRPPLLRAGSTDYELRLATVISEAQIAPNELVSRISLASLPDLQIDVDQVVIGTELIQTFTFTNLGSVPLAYTAYRSADPDLDYGLPSYSFASPEPQPAPPDCPAGDTDFGANCCPSHLNCDADNDGVFDGAKYNTRKGAIGFNIPELVNGEPAACSYGHLDGMSTDACVVLGDGGGDATWLGYRIAMGQSNGSGIHAEIGDPMGFYVQDRCNASTRVHHILEGSASCGQSPATVGDLDAGLGWDYGYGVGGAGDVGIWTAWNLMLPAGQPRTLVQTTAWLPAQSCNNAPVADATATLDLPTCDDPDTIGVLLYGAASADPDGDLLSYTWSFASRPTGSVAIIDDVYSPLTSFEPDVAGVYVLTLTVTDGSLVSTDTVTVWIDRRKLAESLLCAALAEVNGLPNSAFNANGHQTALANLIEQALSELVDKNDPAKSANKAHAALIRVDGCHGGPPKDDWVPVYANADRAATLLYSAILALAGL